MESTDGCPDDVIFSASAPFVSDHLATRDLIGRTISKLVKPMALLRRILFFVHPERVMLSRLPPHLRRYLQEDMNTVRRQLRDGKFTYTLAGVPAMLMCCAPGAWAELLPRFALTEEESKQEQLWFAHQPEGFAALACVVSKHGSALRTIRVAVQASRSVCDVAATNGAAALLFGVIARGDLPKLNSLTIVDATEAHPFGGKTSFLSPLARCGRLDYLRTLRLSLSGNATSAHLSCLTALARRGGLADLRTLAIYRAHEPCAKDRDVAMLLRAILGLPPASAATAGAVASQGPLADDLGASLPPEAADGGGGSAGALGVSGLRCVPTSIDLTGTLAGAATLEVILDLAERLPTVSFHGRRFCKQAVTVELDRTPAAESPEHRELFRKVQRLLPPRTG